VLHDLNRRASLALVALTYAIALAGAVVVGLRWSPESPLSHTAAADLAATVIVFAASLVYRNSSLYDPYWSVAPLVIAIYWTSLGSAALLTSPRTGFVLALVFWWGLRLTWNWIERWHGLADEDWRYVRLRQTSGRFYWLVNFGGIHLFPTILVFAGCLPLYPALSRTGRPFGWLGILATLLTATAIWIEGRADRELRRHRSSDRGQDKTLSSGVWARCRHPNYLGEIAFWWGLFLFGLEADPAWWWTMAGPVAITLLFVCYSIPAMEKRLRESRHDYLEYARKTPLILPWRLFG